MKKVLSLILAFVMCLSLFACGKSEEKPNETNEFNQVTTEETEKSEVEEVTPTEENSTTEQIATSI